MNLKKIDPESFRSFYFDTVRALMAAPSPTGYPREIAPVIERAAADTGCRFERTGKGGFVLTYPGKSSDAPIGACAHCDTIGAMVKSIDPDGGISFAQLGGPLWATLDGEYCTVIARDGRKYTGTFLSRSPSVHVYADAKSRPRDPDNMYVRLDEDVRSAAGVRALGIENGDFICFDTKTTVTPSGFLKSRFIDDKASVACLITALRVMHDAGFVPENDIKIVFTMYEEVGHGGACMPQVREMLGVDMGCIGTGLACTEHDVSICAKDVGGPYDFELTSRLVSLAKAAGLSYAVDLYTFYGSDIGAMWRGGQDIPGALIGPGVHASHGMERTHFDGIANTVALILLYFGYEVPVSEVI